MAKAFTVTAVWDPEAEVFTTKSDIPGLVVEAATFEELVDLFGSLAPEVIAANVEMDRFYDGIPLASAPKRAEP